jgi:hypothetical protein
MRTRLGLAFGIIAGLTCWYPHATAASGEAQPGAETKALQSLQAAIRDLRETFGVRYPSGEALGIQARSVAERQAATGMTDSAEVLALQRAALLANPLVRDHPILFVARHQYTPDHHNSATFFPKATTEYNNGRFKGGAALKTIHLGRNGEVRTLLELPEGVVRDPEVHYDGRRILFSLRRGLNDSYHLYEFDPSGGLRQLTSAEDVDDLDPVYLPDDTVVFTSTREPKYCMCNRHLMANLYRMEADGANIHKIGNSTLFEGHPTVMPDGRILYDRWEYVDRNFGDAQSLWTTYPDGASHAVYWGNNTASPGAVIDARAIPGTDLVMAVFGSCHDRPWGALAVLDRRLGLDGAAPVGRTWPADAVGLVREQGWEIFDAFMAVRFKYEDPYPLFDPSVPEAAGKYFLCSRMTGVGEQMGLYLIDVFGNEVLLHTEGPGCFDPMPLAPRPREPILPSRRDFTPGEGYFYVQDVYEGTHMAGVKRGAVKSLRVVESPEKRFWTGPAWNGQGQEAPGMNWHDFNNKRILGTVPVEADGSAYFAVPAEKFVYFQLLDERGMMVQSMRSGTLVQVGERQGCAGCHENRRHAPRLTSSSTPLALRRDPSPLRGWHGEARLFSYVREVQPVFDRHCVRCHDHGQPAGTKLNLSGDRDLVFNTSYIELWRKGYVKVVGAGPAQTQPAFSWGSHASRLTAQLVKALERSDLSAEDFDRVVTWMDINAPFYPSYASAFPDNLAGRAPLTPAELEQLERLTGVALHTLAAHNTSQGPQVCFDRPELSPCLARLRNRSEPDYQQALDLIRTGQARLNAVVESDADELWACPMDRWRQQQYGQREQAEARRRVAIREGKKLYDTAPE